jgi:nitrogen fixation NifU-like protein
MEPAADVHIEDAVMTEQATSQKSSDQTTRELLAGSGYSETAISYYIDKPNMGSLDNADQVSEMTGTCGDTMKIYLKLKEGRVEDARYQVMGCPGAIAAAMAAVDLVKGKTLAEASQLNDGDVFRVLEQIPGKKHHCIQLAVKTLQKAIDEYSR